MDADLLYAALLSAIDLCQVTGKDPKPFQDQIDALIQEHPEVLEK